MKNTSKARKILDVVLNVITYLFFVICICALVLSITAKRDSDGAVQIFGMQMRIAVSPSMEACDQTDVSGYDIGSIPVKAMVFTKVVPKDEAEAKAFYDSLKVGDVLTFKYTYATQETITHRITKIVPKDGGYEIELYGDNKNSDTETLSQVLDTTQTNSTNYVIGKVVAVNYPIGLLLTALKSPIGLVCMIIIPCIVIMIFEIWRIISILSEKKRKEREEQDARKDDELEQLRARLAELENSAVKAAEEPEAPDDPADKQEPEVSESSENEIE